MVGNATQQRFRKGANTEEKTAEFMDGLGGGRESTTGYYEKAEGLWEKMQNMGCAVQIYIQ